MNIIRSRPPNYEAILAVFPHASHPTIMFSYGDDLYVPGGGTVTFALQQHEEVHSKRQLEIGVEVWWQNYLHDTKFRFDEELPAHRVEYRVMRNMIIDVSRHERRSALKDIAKRLASPLYGSMITYKQAKRVIRE